MSEQKLPPVDEESRLEEEESPRVSQFPRDEDDLSFGATTLPGSQHPQLTPPPSPMAPPGGPHQPFFGRGGRSPVRGGRGSRHDSPPGGSPPRNQSFIPEDINLNVTYKRAPPDVDEHLKGKKVKYKLERHIDLNRDLYFIKLVAGALKRKFTSLIVAEDEKITPFDNTANIKYTYTDDLLQAWATVLEKVKDMIPTFIIMSDRSWEDSIRLHERIIEKDTLIVAFARYVSFIMNTESNNLVPRNRTRYVLDDIYTKEDERAVELMRAVKKDFGFLHEKCEQYI